MKRLLSMIMISILVLQVGCSDQKNTVETDTIAQNRDAEENSLSTEEDTALKEEDTSAKEGNSSSTEDASLEEGDIPVKDEDSQEHSSEEDFTTTMYDYSFAGIKSAKSRVNQSDYVNALDYGIEAGSDKVYSDEIVKAVADAAAKGKYLFFPQGTYYVKNVKIRNIENVRICGEGEKTVFKTADDAVGEEKWDIAVGLYDCSNCVIRNITFDGNNKKVAGNLSVGVLQLRIDNCTNASVYGCRFQNNNSGNINVVGQAEGLRIFYCDFLNSDCSVVVMPGYITNGFICNNYIDGQEWEWSEPISLYNAPEDDKPNNNVYICGNDIRNHTQGAGGVFITYPSKEIYVLGNYFYRCGAAIGSGSRLQSDEDDRGPWDVTCKDNVIDSPTWHGFALLYAEGWTIENNTISNVTDGFAMYLDRCRNNVIKNNHLNGSRVNEIDSSGNTISGNQ